VRLIPTGSDFRTRPVNERILHEAADLPASPRPAHPEGRALNRHSHPSAHSRRERVKSNISPSVSPCRECRGVQREGDGGILDGSPRPHSCHCDGRHLARVEHSTHPSRARASDACSRRGLRREWKTADDRLRTSSTSPLSTRTPWARSADSRSAADAKPGAGARRRARCATSSSTPRDTIPGPSGRCIARGPAAVTFDAGPVCKLTA